MRATRAILAVRIMLYMTAAAGAIAAAWGVDWRAGCAAITVSAITGEAMIRPGRMR